MGRVRHSDYTSSDLRQALLDYIDQDAPSAKVKMEDGAELSVRWLAQQFSKCMDCLPVTACDALELPQGSTFADASRKVRAELAEGAQT